MSTENKQIFYPETLRADSVHSYDMFHYLIKLNLPMNSRYLAGAVTIAMRSNIQNLNRIDLYLLVLNVDSVKVDGINASYAHIADTIWVSLPHPYHQGDSFNVFIGYSGTASGNMDHLFYQSLHPIAYTLGCPFAEKRWFPCYDQLWDKAELRSGILYHCSRLLHGLCYRRILRKKPFLRVMPHTTGSTVIPSPLI